MLKDVFGTNLIAPVSLHGSDKVLECATGSGIWLLDIARTLPKSVTLRGTDIETRMFPSKDDLAENVKFSVASVLDLPSAWTDQFKLVHMRLIVWGLQCNEWPVAIKEMYRVLAPGGWVQITELGDWTVGPVTDRHRKLLRALSESKNLMIDCCKHIPSMLSDSGFVNVQTRSAMAPIGKSAGQLGATATKNAMLVFEGMKTPTLAAGGFGIVNSAEEFDTLLNDMRREWDEIAGPGVGVSLYTFYGQKKATE